MTLATTVDALLDRVRRDALLGLRGPVYTVGASYTASATSLVLNETPEHLGVGSLVSVDAELFFVRAVDVGSKTLTVIPGYFGSTQANHSLNAVVEVDPRVPKAALIDHAYQEILSWADELWRVSTLSPAVSTREATYDLGAVTGDIYFLLDVRASPLTATMATSWFSWSDDRWPHVNARLLREMPSPDFTGGFGLQLIDFPRNAASLRVAIAQPFVTSTFDLTTDLVATVGLETSYLDILEFGVRARALASLTTARVDWRAAGMSRDAEEVTPLDMIRTSGMARDMRLMRLKTEGLALRARWPYRSE